LIQTYKIQKREHRHKPEVNLAEDLALLLFTERKEEVGFVRRETTVKVQSLCFRNWVLRVVQLLQVKRHLFLWSTRARRAAVPTASHLLRTPCVSVMKRRRCNRLETYSLDD
jgi:hypothetical protein